MLSVSSGDKGQGTKYSGGFLEGGGQGSLQGLWSLEVRMLASGLRLFVGFGLKGG